MSRLIDADHLLEEIAKLKESPWFNEGKLKIEPMAYSPHVLYITRKEAVEIIEDLCIKLEPIVERPKGKWILHRYDNFEDNCEECSICHRAQFIGNDNRFCPYCGADMREEE